MVIISPRYYKSRTTTLFTDIEPLPILEGPKQNFTIQPFTELDTSFPNSSRSILVPPDVVEPINLLPFVNNTRAPEIEKQHYTVLPSYTSIAESAHHRAFLRAASFYAYHDIPTSALPIYLPPL